MKAREPLELFALWSTPVIADACVRAGVPCRMGAQAVRPLLRWMRLAGPVRPVRHYGSVAVFLELAATATAGEVVIIDNGGRTDEACVGDLTALELRAAGFSGAIVWGLHRDTTELAQIEWPVFSLGAWSRGPQRLDAREENAFLSARCGETVVGTDDFVFADQDGIVFIPRIRLAEVVSVAREIHALERQQATALRSGTSLREQLQFGNFVQKRHGQPSTTFREHLRSVNAAVEQ